jgi:hypothetical protein
MARGYIQTLLNTIPAEYRTQLVTAFDYVQDNGSLGPIEAGKRAGTMQIYWFAGTTAATAGDEFSIRHGLGQVPSYVIPGAPLDAVNASMVPLTVSRAADAQRAYFTSSSTGAAIYVGMGV